MSFKTHENRAGGAGALVKVRTVASTQYTSDQLCKVTLGVLTICAAQGDKPTHKFVCIETPPSLPQQAIKDKSTAAQEMALCVPIGGSCIFMRRELVGNSVPQINGVACNANAVATTLKVTKAGDSANDYLEGECFVPEIGEQRHITADAYGANEHTFTVAPAFSRAPTTGDTVVAVPFSRGFTSVKLGATAPDLNISTVPADDNGGNLKIEDVVLTAMPNPYVVVSVPDLE